jgi:hypothetical protein
MRLHFLVVLAGLLAVCGLTAAAIAEDGKGQARRDKTGPATGRRAAAGGASRSPRGESNPLLLVFDTNQDGAISMEEIEAVTQMVKKLDANGDGQIARDELPAAPKGARGGVDAVFGGGGQGGAGGFGFGVFGGGGGG